MRHGADIVGREERVGKQDVRAGLGIDIETVDDLRNAIGGGSVRPRADHEIGIAPRIDGGLHLVCHLLRRNDALAFHVTAALRPDLIFDRDRSQPRLFEGAGHEMDIESVAVTGIRVSKQRNTGAFDESATGAQIFVESQDAAIGPAEQVLRKTGTGNGRCLVARTLDEPHAEAVEHARENKDLRGLNHPAECASIGHSVHPP